MNTIIIMTIESKIFILKKTLYFNICIQFLLKVSHMFYILNLYDHYII